MTMCWTAQKGLMEELQRDCVTLASSKKSKRGPMFTHPILAAHHHLINILIRVAWVMMVQGKLLNARVTSKP